MKIYMVLLTLVLAACGSDASREQASDSDEATAAQADNRRTDQSGVFMSAKLKGTLYFNDVSPMEAPKAMALDLASGRFSVATDGIHPSVANEHIAYVHFCSPLSVQLAITDADGFMTPLSNCVDRDSISDNSLQGPAISPDGKRIAVLNHEIQGKPDNPEDDKYGLRAMVGAFKQSGTQVYDTDGNLLASFKDMGPATWTSKGDLILAGRGGDVGFGIFRADRALRKTRRIDDGRLKSNVDLIDAHPRDERIAFVFNGSVFEMPLDSGKPKRLHAHGNLLSGLSYSGDGRKLAFVSGDTLGEAMQMGGKGYPIFVYDDGDIETIRLPFVVAGPLDWSR